MNCNHWDEPLAGNEATAEQMAINERMRVVFARCLEPLQQSIADALRKIDSAQSALVHLEDCSAHDKITVLTEVLRASESITGTESESRAYGASGPNRSR